MEKPECISSVSLGLRTGSARLQLLPCGLCAHHCVTGFRQGACPALLTPGFFLLFPAVPNRTLHRGKPYGTLSFPGRGPATAHSSHLPWGHGGTSGSLNVTFHSSVHPAFLCWLTTASFYPHTFSALALLWQQGQRSIWGPVFQKENGLDCPGEGARVSWMMPKAQWARLDPSGLPTP
jgi:hypothetical protein